MCQLSIVNLKNRDLNLLTLYDLSFESSKIHDDGFGYIYNGTYGKTKHCAKKLSNFGTFVGDNVNGDNLIFGHIRLASTGVEITDENAHPFETDDFLLMHNGTLTEAGKRKSYTKGRESDSKLFADKLQEEYNKVKKVAPALKSAMKGFWGKFAFLIYCKKDKKYYVARGKTAKLYISYLLNKNKKPKGFILNTSEDNLKSALTRASNTRQIISNLSYKFSTPELVEDEAVFRVGVNGLIQLGDIKENDEKDFEVEKPAKAKSYRNEPYNWPSAQVPKSTTSKKDPVKIISKYMTKHCLHPRDIIIAFKLFMSVDMIDATEQELSLFAKEVVPNISAAKSTRKFIKKSFQSTSVFPPSLYKEGGLEFPWPINNQQDVVKAVKAYLKRQNKQ